MARIELRLPQYGMGMSDAEIVERSCQAGDVVGEGDVLLIAEAAKSTVEISAPTGGRIVSVVVNVGDVPLVGDLLLVIDTDPTA